MQSGNWNSCRELRLARQLLKLSYLPVSSRTVIKTAWQQGIKKKFHFPNSYSYTEAEY